MKNLPLICIATCLLGSVPAGYWLQSWKSHVMRQAALHQLQAAREALDKGDYRTVQQLLNACGNVAPIELRADWTTVEIRLASGLRDAERLKGLFQDQRETFLKNEPACLLLARVAIAIGQHDTFQSIRDAWRSANTPNWLLLDADVLIHNSKPTAAIALLEKAHFLGHDESMRLARLALLQANPASLPAAWDHLMAASNADGTNADVRFFRAQFLEATAQPSLARTEYVASLMADPKSPLCRDHLAQFYQRQGQLDHALAIWAQGNTETPADFLALKTAFWSRVLLRTPAVVTPPPQSQLAPLLVQLNTHPQWDTAAITRDADLRSLADRHQETLWLTVIDHLQHRRELEAYNLLRQHNYKRSSFQPALENALIRTLEWRLHQRSALIAPPSLAYEPAGSPGADHPFLIALQQHAERHAAHGVDSAKTDAALAATLRSPNAFASAFLAAGWREAALQLADLTADAATAPVWLTYGLAQCMRTNRSDQAALDYLNTRPGPAAELQLLKAEILLAQRRDTDATTLLTALATDPSPSGQRAAWLLATAAEDKRDFEKARRHVQSNAALAADVVGQELLARLELTQGHYAEAARIYAPIAETSTEARMFQARLAFTNKDYPAARTAIQQLIRTMPECLEMRQNLAVIAQAEVRKE